MVKKRFLNFNRYKLHYYPLILSFLVVIFLTIGVFIYWQAGQQADKIIAEWTIAKQKVLARSGSLSISEFFKERKANLLLLAEVEAIKAGKEKEGREVIKSLIDQLCGQTLVSIVRVDKEGRSLWSDNPQHQTVETGIDLSDREYFFWAKEQKKPGEVYISQPLLARSGPAKGELVLVMAAPVFYQDSFNGLVFMSFSLKALTEKYVLSLVYSSDFYSILITNEGAVVASTFPEVLGRNVLEYTREVEWKGKEMFLRIMERALAGKEGDLIHDNTFLAPFNKQFKGTIVYVPVKIGEQIWTLWVIEPYENALNFVSPLKTTQTQGLIFGLFALLIIILIFVFNFRVVQKDAFLDGFKDGRNGIKKKS